LHGVANRRTVRDGGPEMATLRQIQVSALSLAIALVAAWPSAADEAAITIAGHVAVNGKPLADGMIIFYLDADEFVGSKVKGGNYKVTRVPAGTWRVSFQGDEVASMFASEDSSPLIVEV